MCQCLSFLTVVATFKRGIDVKITLDIINMMNDHNRRHRLPEVIFEPTAAVSEHNALATRIRREGARVNMLRSFYDSPNISIIERP